MWSHRVGKQKVSSIIITKIERSTMNALQNINNEVVIYQDGEVALNVSLENETVWLNRHQLAELFDRDVKTIGKHINNIFKEEELEKNVVVANFATTTQHGAIKEKTQTKLVEYYNLDVIISVGYRVKSKRGVAFRQWATKVLKEYIYNGFAVNREKITQQRLLNLEKDIEYIKSHIKDNTIGFSSSMMPMSIISVPA